MHTILVVVHLFLAIGIIGLVLMQHGKGADAGAAFGSGASGTVFGSRGSANFLSRSTGILAALFFVTSLALAWFAMKTTDRGGLMDKVEIAPPPAVVNPNSAVPAIPGVAPAVEAGAAKSAVPTVPESKPVELPAVQVEAPAQPAPVAEPTAAAPADAPQVEAPAQPATEPAAAAPAVAPQAEQSAAPEAPAAPVDATATEQVPAKTE